MDTPTITVAYGDSHAPGVMETVLTVLREAGANIRVESIEIGSRIYAMDSKTGILPGAWQVLQRTGVLLMAPIEVPEGCEDTGKIIRQRMGLDECEPMFFYPYIPSLALPLEGEGSKSEALAAGGDDYTARAYINENFALFEPVYSDATLQAKNKSDPSPMLHAAILMLTHLQQYETAEKIHNAWLVAMEDGYGKKRGKKLQKLTQAVIERLGKRPKKNYETEKSANPFVSSA